MQVSTKSISFSISQKAKNMNAQKSKIKVFASFFIVFLIICMILRPNLCIKAIYDGLSIWAKCVVPSLLPFMFFTKILTNLNFISTLSKRTYKMNKFLFNAPKISSYIFLMSVISGYPVGAKLISEYHKMGVITTKQANKLCTFCSTSGPLFIIGSVGTAMMLDAKIGYIMFISHILGAILNGVILRKRFVDNTEIEMPATQETQHILQNAMQDSILSVLVVGGYIAISFLVIDVFFEFNLLFPFEYSFGKLLSIFGVQGAEHALIAGILEVSKGALLMSKLSISKRIIATLTSFLIGFGGISVLLQATTFLKNANVSIKFYIFQKITHGILSAGFTFLICTLVGIC